MSRRGSAACASASTLSDDKGVGRALRGVDGEPTSAGSVSHSACQPPGRALVFLRHRGEHRRDESRRPHRRGDSATAPHGIVLVRHRRGSARAGAGVSKTSPTSVCASSARSRPILPSVPHATPSPHATSRQHDRDECATARQDTRERQPAGKRVSDGWTTVAERRQRAGCAAELQRPSRRSSASASRSRQRGRSRPAIRRSSTPA